MKTKLLALLVATGSLFVTACSDDDKIDTSDVNMQYNLPESLKGKDVCITNMNASLVLTNKNTGLETKQDLASLDNENFNIEDGIYDVLITGDVKYTLTNTYTVKEIVEENGKKVEKSIEKTETIDTESKIRGINQNVSITGGQTAVKIDLFLFKEGTGFVISEVFFAGTQTPEKEQYLRDQYIEIYNNSDKTLYADGLCIGETEFGCNWVRTNSELSPNLISTRTVIDAVYRIPGNGKDHPVLPGQTILLCDIAKNHKTDNANSFDLSGADFEWYDDDSKDIDVAEVPNLEKVYSSSATIFGLHSRGEKSFLLFKLDKTAKQFLEENDYDYSYLFQYNSFSKTMNQNAYDIPNESIIDAVGCATPSSFLWNVLDPSLDLSWTHSGDSDEKRWRHSVRRKVSHKETNGRIVLIDTNNSALDFTATAEPTPGNPE
ncbi:MAG: DUF4876 domain-containing protein [Marinifilaceae bacterium]